MQHDEKTLRAFVTEEKAEVTVASPSVASVAVSVVGQMKVKATGSEGVVFLGISL